MRCLDWPSLSPSPHMRTLHWYGMWTTSITTSVCVRVREKGRGREKETERERERGEGEGGEGEREREIHVVHVCSTGAGEC